MSSSLSEMTAAAPPSADDDRHRWRALTVLCTAMLMVVLDGTVVNVALPSIQEDLGFSQSGLAWVVNAYMVAFGGLLLLSGRLGDLLSRRDTFLAGLAVFTLASMACGLAWNQESLVAARFVQGLGGALASAVVLGMIVTLFPEPREQARAIGVFSFVASAGGSIGLLAGGVLTDAISWHWIFFVNAPIGVGVAVAAVRLLERDRGPGFGEGADALGAVLVTSALMLFVFTIVGPAAEDGWGAPTTLLLGAGALVLLGAFVVRQARARNPLMPLRVFRSRTIVGANLVQLLGVAGMFAVFFLGALYLQQVLGYEPLEVGLAFLPLTLVMGGLSLRLTASIAERIGTRRTMLVGQPCTLAALLLFTQAPVDGSYVQHVLPVMVLLGLGAGLTFPCVMQTAMSDATPSDAGLASGLVSTTAQVGGALGLAVLATLSATETDSRRAAGEATAEALNGGYHLAYVVAAGLVAAAIAVTALVLRPDGGSDDAEPGPAADREAVLQAA